MSPPETVILFIAEIFSTISERFVQALGYLGFTAQEWGLAERKKRRRAFLGAGLGLVLLSLVGLGAYLFSSYKDYARMIEARVAAGRLQSRAGLYAAPRTIFTGEELAPDGMKAMLQRAGYIACDAPSVGCYTLTDQSVIFYPYLDEGAKATDKVEVTFAKNSVEIISADGVSYDRYRLDPELLAHDAAAADATKALTYQELPPLLAKGIVAVEDKDFLTRRGADWRSAAGAVWRNLGPGNNDTATITQKLARNTYLLPERALRGSFTESLLGLALEKQLSREEILALYCNEVYLGQRGATAIYGVAQGATAYFGKELANLTLAETATLIGLLQSPQRYAPDRRPDAALAQRNAVLAELVHAGLISGPEATTANQEALALAPYTPPATTLAPYFAAYANRLISDKLEAAPIADEGSLRVYTTLEPDVQRVAETTLQQHLAQLDQTNKGLPPQGALVALDAKTGQIVALVGGRDYRASSLNRATDVARAPGAVFLPFVYATALEQGVSQLEPFNDAPRTFTYENAAYTPVNENNAYANRAVPLRDGLVSSLNVVTTDVSLRTGLNKIVNTANRVGLPQKNLTPALALGVNEATPLALASAYSAFPNGGQRAASGVLVQALDAHGSVFFASDNTPEKVFSPATAYMITHTLQAVMEEGAGKEARAAIDKKTALAGKNGTVRNGWFVGYTPSLVCAVWLGHDDNSPLAENGADLALKVWTEFIKEATAIRTFGGEQFSKPEEVRLFKVDLDNSKLANGYCERHAETALLLDQVPAEECAQHTNATLAGKTEPAKPIIMLSTSSGKNIVPFPSKAPALPPAPAPETTAPPVKAPVTQPVNEPVQPPKSVPPPQARPVTPPLILAPPVVNTRPDKSVNPPARRVAAKELSPRPS